MLFMCNLFLTSYNFCTLCCNSRILEKRKKQQQQSNGTRELYSRYKEHNKKLAEYETRDFFFFFLRRFHNKDCYNIVTVNDPSAISAV